MFNSKRVMNIPKARVRQNCMFAGPARYNTAYRMRRNEFKMENSYRQVAMQWLRLLSFALAICQFDINCIGYLGVFSIFRQLMKNVN
jgi:hypothetical protein